MEDSPLLRYLKDRDNGFEFTFNGLPVVVADDDFCEHLQEHGFDSIEMDELFIEYADWEAENVECN